MKRFSLNCVKDGKESEIKRLLTENNLGTIIEIGITFLVIESTRTFEDLRNFFKDMDIVVGERR